MKEQYDREGVEVIDNEGQIGQNDPGLLDIQQKQMMKQQAIDDQNEQAAKERSDGSTLSRTKSGRGVKPGGSHSRSDYDLMNYQQRNTNMGMAGPNQLGNNPFA
jgi:hypothetical protein